MTYAGTNKDNPSRPNFGPACDRATKTTRAIINQLLDWPGVAGNLKATAALMGARTIAFAIDTTGSMSEDMPFVKTAVDQIVSNAEAAGETSEYLLVRFGDDAGEPFITNDAAEFRAEIDSLAAAGGGDCPEMSATGTLKATAASIPGSTVYIYTDASVKDASSASAATALAAERDIQLHPRLTGSCSPIDPVYRRMATETGGLLFSVQPSQLPSLTALSGSLEPLLVVNDVLSAGPRTFQVSVDPTIQRVVFSVSGDGVSAVSVTRPDGSVVSPGAPGTSVVTLATGALVSVDLPSPGSWTVTVQGTGEYSLTVHGNTPLFVDSFKFAVHVEQSGFYELSDQPLANQAVTAVGRVEGTSNPVTFEAIAADGTPLILMPLGLEAGHPDAAEGEYAGTFNTTTTPFRVLVRGVEGGFPFQRIVPELIRPQFVRVLAETLPDPLLTATVSTVGILVSNTGPAATFDIVAEDDRGSVVGVSPQTVWIAQNGTASGQVSVEPPPASGLTTMHLTVSAVVQGQPEQVNSTFVNLFVKPAPPPSAHTMYYLHQESSTVTVGAHRLMTIPADSPTYLRVSGNMKSRPPRTAIFGWWDTDQGVPGLAGYIPSGSVVTVTQWMRKTTNRGTVFPYATMGVNDVWGASFCTATGTTALTTQWAPYTFGQEKAPSRHGSMPGRVRSSKGCCNHGLSLVVGLFWMDVASSPFYHGLVCALLTTAALAAWLGAGKCPIRPHAALSTVRWEQV